MKLKTKQKRRKSKEAKRRRGIYKKEIKEI
jgi:hypothetical protein